MLQLYFGKRFAQDTGKYEAAEPLYIDALQMTKELLGDRHPDVALSMNNLAWLYRNREQYARAMPLYEQAFDIRLEVLGANHPYTKDVAQSIEIVRKKMTE
ncbi:MAG: tetratricopeptide repeat protein [Limnothrix sp. RL_2_0]|nr:tetratricopeptide repeat protein [Limnothrix sp. RL_2_0]